MDERAAITYPQLLDEVVRAANGLKALGVGKGTPVGIYMGMRTGLPVAMLAWCRPRRPAHRPCSAASPPKRSPTA